MIPQPLKWVGAILAFVIFIAVVAPIAYESMIEMVTFSDDGGLISGSDDPLDEDAEASGAEAAADEDAEEADDPEAADDPDENEGSSEDGDDGSDGDDSGPPDSYVVQSGDTLFSIAQDLYGNGNRWEEIADANDVTDRTGITVGQELVIP